MKFTKFAITTSNESSRQYLIGIPIHFVMSHKMALYNLCIIICMYREFRMCVFALFSEKYAESLDESVKTYTTSATMSSSKTSDRQRHSNGHFNNGTQNGKSEKGVTNCKVTGEKHTGGGLDQKDVVLSVD